MLGCKGLMSSWSGTLGSSISKGNSGSFPELQYTLWKIIFLRLEHYWVDNISYIPRFFSKQWWKHVNYMKSNKFQLLTINVYQHGLPLRMLNTWIKTNFTPPPGVFLDHQMQRMIFQQGCNTLMVSVAFWGILPFCFPLKKLLSS